MKPKRIDVEMSTATLDRLSDIIVHTERTDNCIFMLQFFADGTAEGIYLPEPDALKVKEVLKPIWEKAEQQGSSRQGERSVAMDEFRAWWNRSPINENYKTEGHRLAAKKAWQESRKQAVAEAALRDRHTRESHEEKGALVERERIVGWLRAWAIGLSVIDVKTGKCTFSTKGKILLEVADRIEKE